MAGFMHRCGICEERGSGFDKVIAATRAESLIAPKVENQNNQFTKVTLYSKIDFDMTTKEDRVRTCYMIACLANPQIFLYESYREGKFGKTEFIGRKSEIKAETDKTEAKLDGVIKQIGAAKSDEETLQLPITKYAVLDVYDKRIIASLIEKAEVLGDDTLHVIWKHQDEYDRILDLIS